MAAPISRGIFANALLNMLPRTLRSNAFTTSLNARSCAVPWSLIVPSASITIPAITLNIPDILSDIWEGVLRAVPKKKTSHMKKRHRQLAGKALKDVRSVNSCPACGRPKKAHTLCPYCVAEIKDGWRRRDEPGESALKYETEEITPRDETKESALKDETGNSALK